MLIQLLVLNIVGIRFRNTLLLSSVSIFVNKNLILHIRDSLVKYVVHPAGESVHFRDFLVQVFIPVFDLKKRLF